MQDAMQPGETAACEFVHGMPVILSGVCDLHTPVCRHFLSIRGHHAIANKPSAVLGCVRWVRVLALLCKQEAADTAQSIRSSEC